MEDNKKPIPKVIIQRMPIYLRELSQMDAQGRTVTSSHELGDRLGFSPAQIRKDLSHFGVFGKQGTGYEISHLIAQLQDILEVNRVWKIAVVGVGDIGSALVHYTGFQKRGFEISRVFDNDQNKVHQPAGRFVIDDIADLEKILKEEKIEIAMLTVPTQHAQEVADRLVTAGVKAILNYAAITINVPEHVLVEYIDPATYLQMMTYYLGKE
jgi:redox-sensing transcriptional repressor